VPPAPTARRPRCVRALRAAHLRAARPLPAGPPLPSGRCSGRRPAL